MNWLFSKRFHHWQIRFLNFLNQPIILLLWCLTHIAFICTYSLVVCIAVKAVVEVKLVLFNELREINLLSNQQIKELVKYRNLLSFQIYLLHFLNYQVAICADKHCVLISPFGLLWVQWSLANNHSNFRCLARCIQQIVLLLHPFFFYLQMRLNQLFCLWQI